MPTQEELLAMSEEGYQQYRKDSKRKEKQLDLSQSRFSYARGSTKKQQIENIRKYHKAKKRYYALKEKTRQKRIKKIRRIARNIESVSRGVYKVAKGIPSIKYSESGRARLISNATKGAIPQNSLNAPSIYLGKSKKNKLFRI